MYKIIVGTTPAFKYIFRTVDPGLIETAILTVKDRSGTTIIQKGIESAVVGSNYISWTLTQADTLLIGEETVRVMANWVTRFGVRGASKEESIRGIPNHIEEVI